MEPQDTLVDVELSFGFKITLTTLKLGIPVSNSLVNSDLSFVERKITAEIAVVLDLSMHGVFVYLQGFLSSKL